MEIRAKIWLEKDGELVFGEGRKELLMAIKEMGSLNRAAKRLSMSYRAAWGKLKATEERLGIRLVRVPEERKRMELTHKGEEFLEKFLILEKEAQKAIRSIFQSIFFEG